LDKEPKKLDINAKQQVQYAIPTWLRDEQIKRNCEIEGIGRVQPHDVRTESAAVVCFGPSLKETWEQVRNFKYIFSCSGSHKFLLERGITPTWHCEVDPRNHKIKLLGEPHPDVEYLVSSTCHPDYLKHLEGHKVKLWHVYDPSEAGNILLPAGEWAMLGGCDIGLRALTLAAFLGFRDLHIFGMDQSAGTVESPEERHAAEHPHSGKKFHTVDYGGKTYRTTQAMLEACRGVWHELDQMPKVKCTFYGEGLCQAMAKDYVPKVKANNGFANVIAIEKPVLISAEYRDLNRQLHRENLSYGVGGGKHADVVKKIYKILSKSSDAVSVLDYGAGKGYLAKELPFPIWEYDPAVPGKTDTPRPADFVICTDVLEHIEPDCLRFVLEDLKRCVKQVGFFTIHTGPAGKTLPDGRNTHLIQKGKDWWAYKLQKYFTIGRIQKLGPELYVTVAPLNKKQPQTVNTVKAGAA
jgi:uncharacterized Rossmann fold enzyme